MRTIEGYLKIDPIFLEERAQCVFLIGSTPIGSNDDLPYLYTSTNDTYYILKNLSRFDKIEVVYEELDNQRRFHEYYPELQRQYVCHINVVFKQKDD